MDDKVKRSLLEEIQIGIFGGDQRVNLLHYVSKISPGIILLNENSLIDTDAIDRDYLGKVSSESVNIGDNAGNEEVLSIIRAMEFRRDCSFFPGTLLADFGEYAVPAMPIFENGKMTQLKIKQTSMPYVDDYHALAKRLLEKEYNPNARYGDIFYQEPTKGLMKKLNEEIEALKNLKPVDLMGLNILPVICNELSSIARGGERERPYDGILHSANSWYETASKALEWAERCFHKMKNQERITLPFVYTVAHLGEGNDFSGKYIYDGKNLKPAD